MNRPALIPLEFNRWELAEDFRYLGFTVPAGFVCDLASVPRVPFVYARYAGRTTIAAILHDYLYRRQLVSRKTADGLFYHGMILEGVPWRYRTVMYYAVRLCGWLPWWRNQRKDQWLTP